MAQYDQAFTDRIETSVQQYNSRSVSVQKALDERLTSLQNNNPNMTLDDMFDNHLESVINEVVDETFRGNNPILGAGAQQIDINLMARAYGLSYDSLRDEIESVTTGTFGSRHIVAVMDSIANAVAGLTYQSVTGEIGKLDEGEDLQKGVLYVTNRFGFSEQLPTVHEKTKTRNDVESNRQLRNAFYRYVTRQMVHEYDPAAADRLKTSAHDAASNYTP